MEHGKWISRTTVPVGCFVFHGDTEEGTGTLEDHLGPMAEAAWPERYGAGRRFIDDNSDANDAVACDDAKRVKAIITVTGQFNHPGDPMSEVIGRRGLPEEQFRKSPSCRELAWFSDRYTLEGPRGRIYRGSGNHRRRDGVQCPVAAEGLVHRSDWSDWHLGAL